MGVDNKKRVAIITLVAIMLFFPMFVVNANAANRVTLSASNYMYDDLMYNHSTQSQYTRYIDWTNQDLVTLYNYRHKIIRQYNTDIIDLVDYYNKLPASDQQAYASQFNKVVNALTDYDQTSALYDGNGAFIKAFRFLYLDGRNGYARNEYDCEVQIENIRTAYENFTAFKTQLYEKAAAIGDVDGTMFTNPFFNIMKSMWVLIGGAITNGAQGSEDYMFGLMSYADLVVFVNQYSPLFQTLAYLIFIISFLMNIMETSLRFDITDPKQAIKVIIRVIIGKVMIDGAISICLLVLTFLNQIASAIVIQSSVLVLQTPAQNAYSSVPIIGWIISFFQSLCSLLPTLIVSVISMICMVKVVVKLLIRMFELTCLICVSPVFMACVTGEPTKKYAEKFIVAFLSVAASIIFIAIVYAVGCDMLSSITSGTTGVGATTATLIGIWAICKFITNPPKILSQLIS